jgi:hypothetical protein
MPRTIRALVDTAPCLAQKSPWQDGGDDEEAPETGSTELCQRRQQAQTRTIIYLGRDQKLGVERRYRAGWPNWCVSYLGDRAVMSWN